MADYYYLIASLPELSLNEPPSQDRLEEALQLIQRQLSPPDQEAFRWFLYRNDVYNLIEFWQDQQNELPPRPLRYPHSVPVDDFPRLSREAELLPAFLQPFMEANANEAPHWPATVIENRLHGYFFEALDQAPHPFLRAYFSFEDELRAIIATYHQAEYDFIDSEPLFLSKNLRQSVRKGQAGLTENLRLNLPFLPELLRTLAEKDVAAISTQVHKILWGQAEELSRGHYFDLTVLLAYAARLMLLFRRKHLDSNRRADHLEHLIQFAINPQNSAT